MSAAPDAAYRALIDSDRVSTATRTALLARAAPDDADAAPRAVPADAWPTLRAAVERIVPQDAASSIDLAARIDAMLAGGASDGWRVDSLPPDAEAYAAGLRSLDGLAQAGAGADFAQLGAAAQDAILAAVADGTARAATLLTPPQLQAWFEDLRADAVRAYVSHPHTLAALGYSGIAYGGDGEPKPGFVAVGLDAREAWEPAPTGEAGP